MSRKQHFNTRQLVTIALFSCLGAVLSTYIGYLGQAFGAMTGLPVSGQLLTGLHVLWITLSLSIADRKGAGLLAAILNNILQFLMGSHLGILVLPVGLLQGICAELGYWPLKRFSRIAALVVAGGFSSWSNLVVHQVAFNRFGTPYLFGLVSFFALVSGIVFAGVLPYSLHRLLRKTGLIAGAGRRTQMEPGEAAISE